MGKDHIDSAHPQLIHPSANSNKIIRGLDIAFISHPGGRATLVRFDLESLDVGERQRMRSEGRDVGFCALITTEDD